MIQLLLVWGVLTPNLGAPPKHMRSAAILANEGYTKPHTHYTKIQPEALHQYRCKCYNSSRMVNHIKGCLWLA